MLFFLKFCHFISSFLDCFSIFITTISLAILHCFLFDFRHHLSVAWYFIYYYKHIQLDKMYGSYFRSNRAWMFGILPSLLREFSFLTLLYHKLGAQTNHRKGSRNRCTGLHSGITSKLRSLLNNMRKCIFHFHFSTFDL